MCVCGPFVMGYVVKRKRERERVVGWGWLGVCAIVRTEGVRSPGVTSGSDAPGCGCPEPIGGWVCGPIAVPGTITAIPDAEGDQPPRHAENLHRKLKAWSKKHV